MVKVAPKKIKKSKDRDLKMKKALREMERVAEEEMASALAHESHLPYVDLNLMPLSGDDIRLISEDESKSFNIGVIKKMGKDVRMAVINPRDEGMLDFLKKMQREKGWRAHLFVCSLPSMQKIWRKYREVPLMNTLDSLHLKLSGEELADFEKKFGDLLDLKKRIAEIPTTKIIQVIMAGAIKLRASDIHYEPGRDDVRIRYRIDGVLQDIGHIPHEVYRFIVSRIKIMGGMKINVRSVAQDGHFDITLEDGRFDVRVSIVPGHMGETIVMRLLNTSQSLVDVEESGLRGLAFDRLKEQIAKTNGMIITTGPTGSGKTTTLYSILGRLNTPEVKIITIENPVEYEITGITQTQIDAARGYTFANGLRAIVRQDPDIILVGEIRDDETADIAINASLTGHLVLSTLHTNHAAGAIARLVEMGVKPNLIAPAVNAFIAQRLIRRLCPHCKEKYEVAKETADNIKKILSLISPKSKIEIPKEITHMYRPKGCARCHDLGYYGRVGIFEIFVMDETIENLILEMATEEEIVRAAMEDGMITMTQDGMVKAVEGITSIEEVLRVAGQTEFLKEVYERLMSQTLSRSIFVKNETMDRVDKHSAKLEDVGELLKETQQKDLAETIFAAGLIMGASDIHIEPEENDVKIRYRIDEILQTVGKIPLVEYPSLLGDIKHLSGMKTEIREGVADSRFLITLDKPYKHVTDTQIDVRVSIILGGFGETTVMRLLNKSSVALDINKLGLRQQNLDRVLAEVQKPNGIIMNTGPTGSGKSTTLYSLLKVLNKPDVKIITVENPIEYRLEGILQTQVNEKDGYTFPTALRALMRQNPDILMVGEIRDEETAKLALQASLTGHLVLTTLHTNDAAGSVQRLVNMGVSADDISSAINAFMAQRLVRKLCECKKPVEATKEDKERIMKVLNTISPKANVEIPKDIDTIYEPVGCSKCKGIGFKGISPVSEVLVVDNDIREMVAQMALTHEIKSKAVENGMITLSQDGMLKVTEGVTTIDEVARVTEA